MYNVESYVRLHVVDFLQSIPHFHDFQREFTVVEEVMDNVLKLANVFSNYWLERGVHPCHGALIFFLTYTKMYERVDADGKHQAPEDFVIEWYKNNAKNHPETLRPIKKYCWLVLESGKFSDSWDEFDSSWINMVEQGEVEKTMNEEGKKVAVLIEYTTPYNDFEFNHLMRIA